MNKLFAVSAVLFAFALPSVAQGTHLSLSDQKRFDSYYSRWQSYKATNNQSEVRSMEGRMQDVYRHYGIPANTPYGRVASNGGGGWRNGGGSGTRTGKNINGKKLATTTASTRDGSRTTTTVRMIASITTTITTGTITK